MNETFEQGSVFIREGTVLPDNFALDGESCGPGWKSVRGLDGNALGQKIRAAEWHFFYLAGTRDVNVLGREGPETMSTAIKKILTGLSAEKNNSFEITKVTSKKWMGIPYTNVAFHVRNIQETMLLNESRVL